MVDAVLYQARAGCQCRYLPSHLGAKRTVLVDDLGLLVAARVDSTRPHDSKAGRRLLDDSLPDLPRVGEVLADLGYDLLTKI